MLLQIRSKYTYIIKIQYMYTKRWLTFSLEVALFIVWVLKISSVNQVDHHGRQKGINKGSFLVFRE